MVSILSLSSGPLVRRPGADRRPLWTRARTLLFVAMLAAVVGLGAQPASAETSLDVTTPAGGRFQPGRPTPLIVTIQADRAISGTLSATFDGFRAGSQRVEVPGGSSKDIVFIVTVPPWSGSGSVSFAGDNSEDDATARINLISAGGDEVVAVLPELAARDMPDSADVAADIGVARLFPLDVDLLDSGNGVLGPFSQVLVTSGDLEALDEARLAAIESWVGTEGGVLVVDEEPGTPLAIDVEGVGSALAPGTFGYGLGQIVYSNGEAAKGAYDGLIRPVPSTSPDEFPWSFGFGGGFPTTSILASDAGVRIPAIGSIVLVLVGYTVVIGPLLWFVLRRAKREPLLWLVLPALALVTTAGVYVAGQAIRDEANTAHATIYADLPTQRLVSTQVLVTAPNGGSPGVRLPAGWTPAQTASEEAFFDGPFGRGGNASAGQAVLQGEQLAIDLPPGGVGVISAETTEPAVAPSWGFDFEADGDDLVGTVTNLTNHELEEVFVSSASGFARIASIAAGETADVTLRDVARPLIEQDPFLQRLWQFDEFGGDPDGVINPGLLSGWMSGRPGLRSEGFIVIVGWTRDEDGPLTTTRGTTVEAGRTAFLTADRLDVATISPTRGRLEFLRGWNSTRVADTIGPNECGDFPATIRLTPAPGLDPDEAVLAMSHRSIAAFDLWDGDSWLPAGMSEAPAGDIAVSVPDSSFVDGALYLKVQMSCEFWGQADPFPTLRETEPEDEVLLIGALGTGEPTDEPTENSTSTTEVAPADDEVTTTTAAG